MAADRGTDDDCIVAARRQRGKRELGPAEGNNNKARQTMQTPPFWDWSRREATRGAESSSLCASPDQEPSSACRLVPRCLVAWQPDSLRMPSSFRRIAGFPPTRLCHIPGHGSARSTGDNGVPIPTSSLSPDRLQCPNFPPPAQSAPEQPILIHGFAPMPLHPASQSNDGS